MNPEFTLTPPEVKIPNRSDEAIMRLWDYFIDRLGKHPRLYTFTDKRRKMAEKRFAESLLKTKGDYKKAEFMCECAIDALADSDFHNARGKYAGGTKYNDWEIVFRSTEQFEKFLERSNG